MDNNTTPSSTPTIDLAEGMWRIGTLESFLDCGRSLIKKLALHPEPGMPALPFVRVGREMRFEPRRIEAWIEAMRNRGYTTEGGGGRKKKSTAKHPQQQSAA